ncbi:ribosomal protein L24E, partial [Diplocarpon rosae]
QQQQQQQQQVPPQSQHSNPYPSSHGLPQYTQSAPGGGGQHPQELPYYTQPSHPSPYSTPSANGTYSSAAPETPDIMAAAQMSRPYPPISYHTPQSNSPASSTTTHSPHMAGPSGPTGMPPAGNMGPGAGGMGKPSLSGMGAAQLHHHHNHPDGSTGGGDDVDTDEYMDDEQHHHHHQAPPGAPHAPAPPHADARESHAFSGYAAAYPPHPSPGGAAAPPPLHSSTSSSSHGGAPQPISVRAHTTSHARPRGHDEMDEEERLNLFGDIPEAKKRKFILVDDPGKGGRVRVRVTLDTVVTDEIPDSFRKSNSVYPRSWFPTQMQSPPPSARGSRFFEEGDEDDTGAPDGRELGRARPGPGQGRQMVTIPLADGGEAEIAIPRMRKSWRMKEVKLNDLGYRMTWHQSRVFADKTVFLQKACPPVDSYRNKVRGTMEQTGKDVATVAPHFETRVGKRRWNDRSKREQRNDEA